MKNSLNIRPAFYDDESVIVEIINQGIVEQSNAYIEPFGWIEGANWFKDLRESTDRLVVCEQDKQIAGWACLSNYRGGRAALSSVKEITFYVHADFRRLGVASKLIEHLEGECEQLGTAHLAVILLSDNVGSRSLLEKHGYFVWGMFEGVAKFNGNTVGHLYMGKHINIHR